MLIVNRRSIPQRGMQALMVVEREIPTSLLTQVAHGLELAAVHEIGFERVNERLHVRVLPRRPTPRHALPNAADAKAIPL